MTDLNTLRPGDVVVELSDAPTLRLVTERHYTPETGYNMGDRPALVDVTFDNDNTEHFDLWVWYPQPHYLRLGRVEADPKALAAAKTELGNTDIFQMTDEMRAAVPTRMLEDIEVFAGHKINEREGRVVDAEKLLVDIDGNIFRLRLPETRKADLDREIAAWGRDTLLPMGTEIDITGYGLRDDDGQLEVMVAMIDMFTPDDSTDDPVRVGALPIAARYT